MLRRLQLSHVLESGYVNLRCSWEQGCSPGLDLSNTSDPENTHERTAQAFAESFPALFPGKEKPDHVAVGCCAEFAVTAERVRQRRKEEYEYYRKWILKTPYSDSMSGRVFEYSWHRMFFPLCL